MWRKIRVDPQRNPVLEWRWRVPRPTPAARRSASPRAPARWRACRSRFHGDPEKLDFEDRVKLRMAKALTVNGLPYASLLYVWMMNVPVDTVIHSPHTDRVRMIVVESGAQRAGQWVTIRRNVVEDYRRAFGEEPGDIVAVGLMTDYGDDGSPRRAVYGDITFGAHHEQLQVFASRAPHRRAVRAAGGVPRGASPPSCCGRCPGRSSASATPGS